MWREHPSSCFFSNRFFFIPHTYLSHFLGLRSSTVVFRVSFFRVSSRFLSFLRQAALRRLMVVRYRAYCRHNIEVGSCLHPIVYSYVVSGRNARTALFLPFRYEHRYSTSLVHTSRTFRVCTERKRYRVSFCTRFLFFLFSYTKLFFHIIFVHANLYLDNDLDLDIDDIAINRDTDHDLNFDLDIDLEHDIDIDIDIDLEHDIDIDIDIDLDLNLDLSNNALSIACIIIFVLLEVPSR